MMRREMTPERSSRINLGDLQSEMVAKIGHHRAQRYFRHLSRFLVQKLRKVEFDAICLEILGVENVGLHNKFLRSVLWNASLTKAQQSRDSSKINKAAAKRPVPPNEFLLHGSSNGDILPSSPRRSRSTIFRQKDQPSHLRNKKQQVEKTTSNDIPEISAIEQGEEFSRRPIQAPLGIEPRSGFLHGSSFRSPSFASGDGGELCDSEALRSRMEGIASTKGLSGVTSDCADLLNNGLDAYLKRLITSCVDLMGARSGRTVNDSGLPCHRMLMLDLRVAMETNPQQLGDRWSSILEKAYFHSFEG